MAFILIKGTFHPVAPGSRMDGDSVRFMAANKKHYKKLKEGKVKFKKDGTVQLRYEGIDAMEKAALKPFSSDATAANVAALQNGLPKSNDGYPGYILSRHVDGPNGRPVCFVFVGKPPVADGSSVFLDAKLLAQSINMSQMKNGQCYPMFYQGLYAELREELTKAYQKARTAKKGIWKRDKSRTGVTISSKAQLATIDPIFPKLWRRLEDWLPTHHGLSGFLKWLEEKKLEEVVTLDDGRFVHFHDVLEVKGNKLKLLYDPSLLAFKS